MEKLFFETSKQVFSQITNIYDFIWPTSTALWNLRWQVKGYLDVNPNANTDELLGRFVSGSKIHGANIRRAFIEHTWNQQQEELAKFLLINICALYEAWADGILSSLKIRNSDFQKQLQFQTTTNNGSKKGVWNVIESINTTQSDMLVSAFYEVLCSHRKNSKSKLDNLLICYRYFKECRNSIIHRNSLADEKAEEAFQNFSLVANSSDLGVKEVPIHFAVEKYKPISISLRGVVGLSDVVLRMIATIDAELSRSVNAENEFIIRCESNITKKIQLNKLASKRRKQIVGSVLSLGFPHPTRVDQIEKFLKEHEFIF